MIFSFQKFRAILIIIDTNINLNFNIDVREIISCPMSYLVHSIIINSLFLSYNLKSHLMMAHIYIIRKFLFTAPTIHFFNYYITF